MKIMEQEKRIVVKLEVKSTPNNGLEQEKLLMVTLEAISTPIKRLE